MLLIIKHLKKYLVVHPLIFKLNILQGVAFSHVEVSKTVLLENTIRVVTKLVGYLIINSRLALKT